MRRPRGWEELSVLVWGVAALGLIWAFVMLASEVMEGDTRYLDEWMLSALRQADDRAATIGPRWLESVALDITALGGPTVLGLTVFAVTGYLLLHGLRRNATFLFIASSGGWVLNWALKASFDRERPDIVPHLREVMTSSFPSGHALTAAAVYLTLGALLMRIAQGRPAKYFCITLAMLITFLVGVSRVFLGVHYPSDVLGGWLAGMSWALLCLVVEIVLERRAGLRQEQQEHSQPA